MKEPEAGEGILGAQLRTLIVCLRFLTGGWVMKMNFIKSIFYH